MKQVKVEQKINTSTFKTNDYRQKQNGTARTERFQNNGKNNEANI